MKVQLSLEKAQEQVNFDNISYIFIRMYAYAYCWIRVVFHDHKWKYHGMGSLEFHIPTMH